MKLYIARHGRTNYNDLGLCNADPSVDVHLTATGLEQAKTLAEQLRNIPIQQIYISKLRRTRQTADVVNAVHRVPVIVDKRLNDGRTGYEKRPFAEYEAALNAAPDRWNARFGDGESIVDVQRRANEFVDQLSTQNYNTVLVITSLWIIQAIVAKVRGIPIEQEEHIRAPQGSYLELEI